MALLAECVFYADCGSAFVADWVSACLLGFPNSTSRLFFGFPFPFRSTVLLEILHLSLRLEWACTWMVEQELNG